MGQVYKITFKTSGKSYIGMSLRTAKNRFSRHKNINNNYAVGRAFKEYGEDDAVLTILHESNSLQELCELEKMEIIKNNTLAPNGYNLKLGPRLVLAGEESKDTKIAFNKIPENWLNALTDFVLLHVSTGKDFLFLAYMISKMDKDNVVQMTPYIRESIITEIGSDAADKLAMARQYIKNLSDKGLIANIGKGAYMVRPQLAGFSNILDAMNKKQDKFIKIKYSKAGRTIEVGVVKQDKKDKD